MKLEVGMYVRTKAGYIRKCVTVDLEDIDEYELDDFIPNEYGDSINWLNEVELEKYISKASHDITDLIEENDYVNGVRVYCIDEDYGILGENQIFYKEENIKSIVTKEQFESMRYKVGE